MNADEPGAPGLQPPILAKPEDGPVGGQELDKVHRRPSSVSGLVGRYPVIAFMILAYGMSWLIWLPVVTVFARSRDAELSPGLLILGLTGAYGPTAAALILIAMADGRRGIRDFLARYRPSKAPWKWIAIAFLLPACMFLMAVWLRPLAGAPIQPVRWERVSVMGFIGAVVFGLPFGPLGEEGGWRGFLLPALQRDRNALVSGLIVGVAWTGWHLPMFWVPDAALPTGVRPGVVSILIYLATLTYAAVIATAIYNGSQGSLVVAVLYHLGINIWPQVLGPMFGTEAPEVALATRLSGLIAGWIVVLGLVLLFGTKRLSWQEPVK